jgi:hypothetical protein
MRADLVLAEVVLRLQIPLPRQAVATVPKASSSLLSLLREEQRMSQTAYDVGVDHMPPKFALTQFTVDEVQEFWPQLEEMLDAVPHTWRQWTKEYIWRAVEGGRIQAWGIGPPPRAILIFFTTVAVYPAMKILSVEWGAGSFHDEMLPLLDAGLTSYAQLNGCAEVEVKGRLGWEPKWKSIGMERQYSVWTRKVPHNNMN